MDVLVEVHDEAELERACALPAHAARRQQPQPQDLAVDLAVFERLARWRRATGCWSPRAGSTPTPICVRMAAAGARAFLVGESLMREADVTAATRRLLALAA